ncbi:archease [Nonomuraea pusilla]|uniref:archease n=1 Tax=Nonomuraea pusilla TaxID=46177 RepID=UPI003322DF94
MRGHRTLPHTADSRVQAWAPTRGECVAEAVLAVTGSFLDTAGAVPVAEHLLRLEPAEPEDRLVAALEEIIYLMDTTGRVPVRAAAEDDVLRLGMADTGALPQIGAVPKAVALSGLSFTEGPDGWTCEATLDV